MTREEFVSKIGLTIAYMDALNQEEKKILWDCILAIHKDDYRETVAEKLDKIKTTMPSIDMITRLIRGNSTITMEGHTISASVHTGTETRPQYQYDASITLLSDKVVSEDGKRTETVYTPVKKTEGVNREITGDLQEYVNLIKELRPTPPPLVKKVLQYGKSDPNPFISKIVNTCIKDGGWDVAGLCSLSKKELDDVISICPMATWVYYTYEGPETSNNPLGNITTDEIEKPSNPTQDSEYTDYDSSDVGHESTGYTFKDNSPIKADWVDPVIE